ncbi:protein kinase [Duganella sp. FT92W]|uniref:non-specific serine/threonine protein kinase n=1 Tax=Pseudoduganella rivuli TaxID=2666085 RepID=A0A7X2IVC8_9BURK|nr:serine/threonine-protein kinase [Pseudoduganella rivuli]MRV76797.1 protein kinase [Pseudoduganella rivuli]
MAAQNNAPLPEGLEIAGYRIVKKIASGGFSIVYLAYDGEGNAVAIKEYLPSSLALRQPGELAPVIAKANLPVFRIGLKCFFEEGRALARISHPNVVRVLNFFRANETVYMVMAYESGHSLQEQIQRQRAKGSRLGEAFIRQIFLQVVKGLREVHASKLLHLDLKPANIYLRTDGTPMLLDFGAARQTVNNDLPMLTPMYTPGFAPPELYVKTEPLGPWTDIYSIGAAMFACMVGSPPQPADQRRKEDKMAEHFAKLDGHYTPELVDLVRRALAVDPLARPQSLFEIQKVLQIPLAQPPAEPGALEKLGGQVRGLFGRLTRKKDAAQTTLHP